MKQWTVITGLKRYLIHRVYMCIWRITLSVLCVLLDQHVDLLGDLLITTILIDNFKKLLRADVKMSCGNDFRPLHVTYKIFEANVRGIL